MKSIPRTLIPVIIIVLGLPAAAAARGYKTIAPPGDSAVSQYVEVVPTAAGGSPTGSGAPQTGALTPASQRTLAEAGQQGHTLAAIVDATAPPPARPSTGQTGASAGIAAGGPGGSTANLSAGGAPSSAALLAAAVTGGGNGGLGVFLPGIMLAGVIAVIARFVIRRRTAP